MNRALCNLAAAALVATTACTAKPTATPDAGPSPQGATDAGSGAAEPVRVDPAGEGDCTGATALVPGVPGSPGHLIPSDINPNGHSELAHRMRAMLDELAALKPKVEAGTPAPIGPGHERIRCSWPTDPRDRDAAFDGMAVAYLDAVAAYNEAPSVATFNGVVQRCLDCHGQTCGGPMAAIRPLRIGPAPDSEAPGMFE